MSLYSFPQKSTSATVGEAVAEVCRPIETRTMGSFAARLDAKLAELEHTYVSYVTKNSVKQAIGRR